MPDKKFIRDTRGHRDQNRKDQNRTTITRDELTNPTDTFHFFPRSCQRDAQRIALFFGKLRRVDLRCAVNNHQRVGFSE